MQPYQIFSGAAEVIAATLLLFRRTTTLGALVSVGVLLNVVMLNLCYDVSVKLFSINLLLAAVFLAAPDITKLARFFVLNRPMEPAEALGPTFQRRWLATTAVAFKFLFLTAYLYQSISGAYRGYHFKGCTRRVPRCTGFTMLRRSFRMAMKDQRSPPIRLAGEG